ncbi:MAG: NADH-quinone oxidoreductase subunit H [Candidatus Omnitrophota bacterium]
MLIGIFLILIHWLFVFLLAPLFVGLVVKVKAFFAGKKGPSVFQPYFDLVKLSRKQCIYSQTTSWVFRAAPVVALASVFVVSLEIPLGILKAPLQFSGDILLLAYLLALSRFFMIASALDTGLSLEGAGASREAFFSCLSELALFMNFITLACLTQSISLSEMIGVNILIPWNLDPVLLLVVASFFIVLLAENCRIPVDDPDTHLELTMIHEVMILDHSGVDLAYMHYASAVKLFLFSGILVMILIIPFQTGNPVKDMLIFLTGMLGLAVLVGVIESSMARLRLNRVRNLLLIAFALAFFGFVITIWRG